MVSCVFFLVFCCFSVFFCGFLLFFLFFVVFCGLKQSLLWCFSRSLPLSLCSWSLQSPWEAHRASRSPTESHGAPRSPTEPHGAPKSPAETHGVPQSPSSSGPRRREAFKTLSGHAATLGHLFGSMPIDREKIFAGGGKPYFKCRCNLPTLFGRLHRKPASGFSRMGGSIDTSSSWVGFRCAP